MMHSAYESLDGALGLLAANGPELKNGFTDHAPMVAEALCAMGEGAHARDWVAARLDQGTRRPEPTKAIRPAAWESALGDEARYADWAELFAEDIARLGWRETLDLWCARLALGFAAAAAHGPIRVGHAARALGVGESAPRLRELADALALWAAHYQELPTHLNGMPSYATASEALRHVPRVPQGARRNDGAITKALKQLVYADGFADSISALDLSGDPANGGRDAARAFAHVFLAQADSPLTAIVFTHGLTGVTASLNIAPHISDEAARELLAHAWHTGAGLYSAYARTPAPGQASGASFAAEPETPADITRHAVAHGDDHVIKLSQTCNDFYAQTGDDIFATIPRHARTLLAAEAEREGTGKAA